jgi:hypothetical protein
MDNIKKIDTKEYTKDGINVQHFYYEKIISKTKNILIKENLLSNYLVTSKVDGTMLKSIDGGLNWYLFTNENSQVLNFEIYPNPTTDILYVKLQNVQDQNMNITVLNFNGKVMNDYVTIDIKNRTLNVLNLPIGMYFLTISSTNGRNSALQFCKQ